ncbi:MAG TPA: hypothetical protein VN042_13195, partial [Asticcacaulis sp.]|nr:hypothetical protein [Asticcacaulis sp.]
GFGFRFGIFGLFLTGRLVRRLFGRRFMGGVSRRFDGGVRQGRGGKRSGERKHKQQAHGHGAGH